MNHRLRAWAGALLIATAFILHPLAASGPAPASAPAPKTPQAAPAATPGVKLVLILMVDQFRYDYLTRFESAYTNGGFQRLLRDGAVFTNAYLEHFPTVTAAGHATMGTGATLSVSGIIGNDWFDRATNAQVTSVSDPSVQPLGAAEKEPASPHRLLVTTLADEVKMWSIAARKPVSKTIGLSLKDRSAILPVGRGADAAYWFDTANGAFISSTFYQPALPAWVSTFNAAKHGLAYAGKSWPGWQGSGAAPVMPAATEKGLFASIYSSPFGNDLLRQFAETAIAAEKLGQRDTVDVLSVSFSSNDAVGHAFGPDAPEVRTIAIDTDRTLGQLFAAIDKQVGLDKTLIVLSADHGVAPTPETLAALHMPGGRMTGDELFGPVRKALEAKYGPGKWVLATAGSSPYFNYALMQEKNVDPAEARAVAAKAAAAIPQVARVYTRDQLLEGRVGPDEVSQRVLRGFNAQRSGDLEIVLLPHWMRAAKGSTHGSPYDYDAHLPLIFMGPGVKPGRYHRNVALNDAAPTLAALLKVTPPSGSAGRVLDEMFEERQEAVATTAGRRR